MHFSFLLRLHTVLALNFDLSREATATQNPTRLRYVRAWTGRARSLPLGWWTVMYFSFLWRLQLVLVLN